MNRSEEVSQAGGGDGRQEAAPGRTRMPFLFPSSMIAIIALAAVLRLVDLPNRPMHCDEAVHAIKFGRLLEQHEYKYNPHEYHGPTLNYLTLPVAWLSGARRLTEVTETHLRLVPALFGVLLVGLVWLLRKELGDAATLAAALLTAISPGMVFYSRYYIQEMLLVCFSFAAIVAGFRFLRAAGAGIGRDPGNGSKSQSGSGAEKRPLPFSLAWLVTMGVCVALMHASKETCSLALFAMTLALFTVLGSIAQLGLLRCAFALLIAMATATCVSALLFSSFGSHPPGVFDSFGTYFHYWGRAAGEGSAGEHIHPWHYYLRILFWWHQPGGVLWTEILLAALAMVGLTAGIIGKGLGPVTSAPLRAPEPDAAPARRGSPDPDVTGDRRSPRPDSRKLRVGLVRFLSVYTVILAVVYAVIPYKTPWCALGFLHGVILLAGVGAAVVVRIAPGRVFKGIAVAALVATTGQLTWQSYRASFVAYEDRNNPYVYSHTTNDVPAFVEQIRQIARAHPDGTEMHVQVICPDDDFWPLPWYMRDFSRVGWFSEEPRSREGEVLAAAPLIIAQPQMEGLVVQYNYLRQPPGHRHLLKQLPPKDEAQEWLFRPFVPITAYVRLGLWEAYEDQQKE